MHLLSNIEISSSYLGFQWNSSDIGREHKCYDFLHFHSKWIFLWTAALDIFYLIQIQRSSSNVVNIIDGKRNAERRERELAE